MNLLRMLRSYCAALIILAVFMVCGSAIGDILVGAGPPDYFPLAKGNYWIYKANVEFLTKKGDKNEQTSAKLTWKVEVVDTLERGNLFAARLKGFPTDLAWYEQGQQRGDYVIVRAGSASFYLFGGEEAPIVWAKLKDEKSSLGDLEGELWLDTPLIVGKMWGGNLSNYEHGRYCRIVHNEHPFSPQGVKGAPKLNSPVEYDISYQASPEHFDISFVPGIGITGYSYSHHGTLSNAEVSLVEFGTAAQVKALPSPKPARE